MKIKVPLYLLLSIFIALFQVPGSLVGETIFFKQPSSTSPSTSSGSSLIHSLMPFTGVLYCIGLFINLILLPFSRHGKFELY